MAFMCPLSAHDGSVSGPLSAGRCAFLLGAPAGSAPCESSGSMGGIQLYRPNRHRAQILERIATRYGPFLAALLLTIAAPAGASAAVTLNGALSVSSGDSVSSATWSHTVAAGSNRLLVVGIKIHGAAHTVTSVTYGGTAMTYLGQETNTGEVWVFRLLNPAIGTANIVATLNGNDKFVTGAITFNGVD